MLLKDSILRATKDNLDIAEDDTSFDAQVLALINGAMDDLVDFGILSDDGFEVTGNNETWDQLDVDVNLNRLKTWLYLKVRIVWDPPQTSFLMDAFQRQIDEASWRMINRRDGDRHLLAKASGGAADPGETVVFDGGGA